MKIGLAQTGFPKSLKDGLEKVKQMMMLAKKEECQLICFPESILPGLRGVGFQVEEYHHEKMKAAIEEICTLAKEYQLAVILPTEWQDELGLHLVAFVIDENGEVLGYQTKNQIDPDEDFYGYQPGQGREIFEIHDVKFGIVICHEGWRYPETVRWAALREASIVFHPQFTGKVHNPEFFNGAMVGRSLENNIYFASVNYALDGQESTTSLISPSGERLITAKRNVEELLAYEIDPQQASRLLASRFRPSLV
ncbi:carbon-nitrogen hydrolase family protein [Neobacillus sp. D3-1R]|uniref:carbon-nitrogen hydrolase family protein n=1 Tax=Neobacillus sp. D3-1R TaxID=3445778 RepID=UPI003F9F3476